jgi:hypothetical protein
MCLTQNVSESPFDIFVGGYRTSVRWAVSSLLWGELVPAARAVIALLLGMSRYMGVILGIVYVPKYDAVFS